MGGIDIPVSNLGPTGLLALGVLMILTGMLVPRWLHKQRIADKDAQITALQAHADKRDEQLTKLLTATELIIKLLEDIKREADR